jgi:ABC-type dipeptide/oligopeptide/nickel transport system ATPase component
MTVSNELSNNKDRDDILSIRNLRVEFETEIGTERALHDINLSMRRSKTTAIVGESGSGKSVTAYSMMRLIQKPGRIKAGEIHFSPHDQSEFDILSLPENSDRLYELRGGDVAMIFQEPMTALSPVHTIGDQVMEAILTHRAVTKQEAFQQSCRMLEQVGILDASNRMNQYPFEFSGGMRQRVVIAMALVCEPELLICDEPTTALDVTIQAEILSLIKSLKSAFDMSVLFITHDLGVVAQIADDVVVMHKGRILESGTVRQILKAPLHPYTKALLAAIPGRDAQRLVTVNDTLTAADLLPHPLLDLKEGRQVALLPEHIPTELLPTELLSVERKS